METEFDIVQRERLPTLYEVLIQKTSSPVDLWSFYTYLSQFPYAINYLDFWIDLMAHIRLCKDYVRIIRESAISEHIANEYHNEELRQQRLQEQNSNDYTSTEDENISVTTSVLLNSLLDDGRNDFQKSQEMGNHIKRDSNHYPPNIVELIDSWKSHSGVPNEAINIDNPNLAALMDGILNNHREGLPLPHITTEELRSNALHICKMYLISSEESERYLINIPDEVRIKIIDQVKNQERYSPEIFDELKTLTYQFLEIDCFPKFLSRVSLHNIHDEISDWRFRQEDNTDIDDHRLQNQSTAQRTNKENNINSIKYQGSKSPFSNYTSLSRTVFGLIWLGIGFWIGYVLIFLKYSRAIRVTTVVPFAIGCYMIICGMYQVDIIYSWFGLTQRLLFKDNDYDNLNIKNGDDLPNQDFDLEKKRKTGYNNIPFIFALVGGRNRLMKIEHPFIKNLLFKRGLWCCLLVFLSTACFTVIFSCVPGYRI